MLYAYNSYSCRSSCMDGMDDGWMWRNLFAVLISTCNLLSAVIVLCCIRTTEIIRFSDLRMRKRWHLSNHPLALFPTH